MTTQILTIKEDSKSQRNIRPVMNGYSKMAKAKKITLKNIK